MEKMNSGTVIQETTEDKDQPTRDTTEESKDHLASCPDCADLHHTMHVTIRFFGTAAEKEIPESLQRRLKNR